MDKGNVNKHRISIAGVGKVSETQKWGRDTAISRYGKSESPNMKPAEDRSAPQKLGDKNNLRGPNWQDDVAKDWRRGYGLPPNFDKGSRKK
jgi:hypothetical protein